MEEVRERAKTPGCFSNLKLFVLCQGMLQFSHMLQVCYLMSCITTIQQHFGLSSIAMGVVSSIPEVARTVLVVFVSYFGRRIHRPRFIGLGGLIASFAPLFMTLLHFLSDPYQYRSVSAAGSGLWSVCVPGSNASDPLLCHQESSAHSSSSEVRTELLILAASQIIYGCGYILGSTTLSIYVDVDKIGSPKDLMPSDPRWVGAWWMGLLVTSGCLALASIPFFFFPQDQVQTPKTDGESLKCDPKNSESQSLIDFLKEFPGVVLKVLLRPAFLLLIVCQCCFFFCITGLFTFLTKFFENHMVFIVPLFFMGCSTQKVVGVNSGYGSTQVDQSISSSNCSCVSSVYNPVCGEDGTEFISPCHAGCTNVTIDPHNPHRVQVYSLCSCVPAAAGGLGGAEIGSAHPGSCARSCSYLFLPAFIIIGFGCFFHYLCQNPLQMMVLRTVSPENKTLAIGIGNLLCSALASLPSPVLFGSIFDYSCVWWRKQACRGKPGACSYYDLDKLRNR
ncbi:solute carrier organic anion transporter family member 2A1-like [Centroberyx gerrardi]